jgi:hypothetical protein
VVKRIVPTCWIAKDYRDRGHNRRLVMRTHTGESSRLMKYDYLRKKMNTVTSRGVLATATCGHVTSAGRTATA